MHHTKIMTYLDWMHNNWNVSPWPFLHATLLAVRDCKCVGHQDWLKGFWSLKVWRPRPPKFSVAHIFLFRLLFFSVLIFFRSALFCSLLNPEGNYNLDLLFCRGFCYVVFCFVVTEACLVLFRSVQICSILYCFVVTEARRCDDLDLPLSCPV